MSELLSINGTNYLSASDAGKLGKYTSDYITKLAREGKVDATRVGRQWYVNPKSLEAFSNKSEEQKKVRAEKIREERKAEQRAHIEVQNVSESISEIEPPKNKVVALQHTLAILVLGLALGAAGFFVNIAPPTTQEANVIESSLGSIERIALALYRFVAPRNSEYYATLPGQGIQEDITTEGATTTYTSLIVAPDEVFTEAQVAQVRDSFSDEVEVSVDPNNPDTGIIVPQFRDSEGQQYRFLLTPINAPPPST